MLSSRPLILLALAACTGPAAPSDNDSDVSDDSDLVDSPTCGDGLVEGDEACDDGNEEDLDGCSTDCEISDDACADVTCGASTEVHCEANLLVPVRDAVECVVVDGEPTCPWPEEDEALDCGTIDLGRYCVEDVCEVGVVQAASDANPFEDVDARVLFSDGRVASLAPRAVSGEFLIDYDDEGVIGVSVAAEHTCFLYDEQVVRCRGKNTYGQLGAASIDSSEPNPTYPLQVMAMPGSQDAVAVAALDKSTLVLTASGKVFVWGRGYDAMGRTLDDQVAVEVATDIAALGQGSSGVGLITTAGALHGFGNLGWGMGILAGTEVDPGPVRQVVTAYDQGVAIDQDGTVRHYGRASGWSGNGPTTDDDTMGALVEVPVAAALDASYTKPYNCAILADHTLTCWGNPSLTGNASAPAVIDAPDGVVPIAVEARERNVLVITTTGALYQVQPETLGDGIQWIEVQFTEPEDDTGLIVPP